jgi:hypothetical protein
LLHAALGEPFETSCHQMFRPLRNLAAGMPDLSLSPSLRK